MVDQKDRLSRRPSLQKVAGRDVTASCPRQALRTAVSWWERHLATWAYITLFSDAAQALRGKVSAHHFVLAEQAQRPDLAQGRRLHTVSTICNVTGFIKFAGQRQAGGQ
jgi:hypothetical protein